MKELQLEDAKATLSAVVDRAVAGEPTVITRHGRKEAVLVSFEEWQRRLQGAELRRPAARLPGHARGHPRAVALARAGVAEKRSLTSYLLDTNIVSADAPAKRRVDAGAYAASMRRNADHLYISAVTVAEIEAGIARAARIAASTKAERLRHTGSPSSPPTSAISHPSACRASIH